MQRSKLFIAAILLLGITVTGFQCSSTELTSAKLYIQQKNYDKALDALQKEVQKNPKSDEGYYLLGVVHGEKGNMQEMTEAYKKSLEISNKFAKNIADSKKYFWANSFNKGVKFYQQGNNATNEDSMKVYFDRSIQSFQEAIQIEEDSADAYKNIAFVYMSKQDFDKAIPALEKLIEKEKEADGYKFLGEILYNKGQQIASQDSVKAQEFYNSAIKVLEEGRKEYPNDQEILLTLSNSYIAANKIDVAIDAFKAGVEQSPDNQYYRYNYGVLLLGSQDYAGAEKQFLKAIEIDPDYQNAIYNIAVTYVRWGTKMNKDAEEKGEMDNTEYKHKYQQALPYLEQVVQMKEDDAQMWELLGRVYTVLGDQEKATNAFSTADEIRNK